MRRWQSAIALCVAGVGAAMFARESVVVAQQGPFQLSCSTLPFQTIKKDRPIDNVCDRAGDATTAPNQAQNRAKNQFCASGTPAYTTFFTFKQLQSKTAAAGITG